MKKFSIALGIALAVVLSVVWPAVCGSLTALTLIVWLEMTMWSKFRWKAALTSVAIVVLLVGGLHSLHHSTGS